MPICRAGRRSRGRSCSGSDKAGATPTLDQYGRDPTAMAGEDKLDPVVGREKEIERVLQV